MKLDAKFYGVIRKVKNDSIVPEDEHMTFLAHDLAFMPTLVFYRAQCALFDADDEHLAAVDRTIERLRIWQAANPDKMKIPDAKGEKLLA